MIFIFKNTTFVKDTIVIGIGSTMVTDIFYKIILEQQVSTIVGSVFMALFPHGENKVCREVYNAYVSIFFYH